MYCMTEHNSTCTVNKSITHTHSVTPDMVQSAINKIKPGKSDCTDGMLSDKLTNATLKLNMFISVLFSAMLIISMNKHEYFMVLRQVAYYYQH